MFKIGVLASGNGTNLQALIDYAEKTNSFEVSVVGSNVKNARALKRAENHRIPAFCVSHANYLFRRSFEKELIAHLLKYDLDVIVLAGFMRVLTPYFVNTFKSRIVNVHPSLLPSFPGMHAIKQALDGGVKVTGCTVHLVDRGVDTGEILYQRAIEITKDDTIKTVGKRIQRIEHLALPVVLDRMALRKSQEEA